MLEAMKELDAEGIKYNRGVEIGVMMETAAASIMADVIAAEADFFSIGTNDLTQYTLAVDRGNTKISYLYSTYNPAVLKSIRNIIYARKKPAEAWACAERLPQIRRWYLCFLHGGLMNFL